MTVPNYCNEHFERNAYKPPKETDVENDWTKIDGIPIRTFKVIVIGDSGVGKTCLTYRISAGKFPKINETTIGVDVKIKRIKIGNEYIDLQIWDSAGQERFRYGLVPHYYRNVHAVIFVYDVTCRSSFENLRKWVSELHKFVGVVDVIPQIIIGNKSDKHAERQVSSTEAKNFSLTFGLPLWETSAKSDMEIDTLNLIFQTLGETLKLKAPLVHFPPHFSDIIQAGNKKGLNVHQSLSASYDTYQKRRNKQNAAFRRNCCSL